MAVRYNKLWKILIDKKMKKKDLQEEQEAKVNLSATNEMNPYLLLMAHAFIRNTIFIDSNAIVEEEDS